MPDLCGTSESGSDDEWCGGEVGYDELFGDSEPVQSLRGTSSAVCTGSVDSVCAYDQGVQSEPAEHADVRCATSGSTGWSWADVDVLPTAPQDDWQPVVPSAEWAERLFTMLPVPLRQWIDTFEPNMRSWRQDSKARGSVLEVLSSYAMQFVPSERRGAIRHLFGVKGLLEGVDSDMFDFLLCKVDHGFGHVQFKVGDDMTVARFVLSMGDRFYSLIDDHGFSASLLWRPEPMVEDPVDFVAGGVHSEAAREEWEQLPGVSAHVLHWIRHKVWFKKREHKVEHDVRNAASVSPGAHGFVQEMFDFLDTKIQELVKCKAVVQLPKGVKPDVVTRLSLAPKAGSGKDAWRIIMDMRPENARHYPKKVRMEHLSHFSTVFTGELLLFSLDLKSAYFSVSVDERLARTMGFMWQGEYYKFTCLPFGFKLAPYAFVKVGRQVVKKWRYSGPGRDWHRRFRGWPDCPTIEQGVRCMLYIDDSAGGHRLFGLSVWMRNAMMLDLERLGFSLSAKGSLLPFPQLEFLGMLAHLACPTPSWFLPARKAERVVELAERLVEQHREGRQVLCKAAAKVVGKLVSAARAVPVSKILFREVNACIYESKQPNWGGSIWLSGEAVRDLLWIIECFLTWNGRASPIWVESMVRTVDCVLVQDAGPRAVGFALHDMCGIRAVDAPGGLPSVEAGVQQLVPTGVLVDAVLDKHTLYASSGTIELTDAEADMHHVHKELVGVVLAVASRRFELENKRVCLLVDSTTSVAYIANWGGPSLTCNRIVRRLWGICARFGIRVVQVSHIAGSVMITSGVDALSRPYKFARGSEADRDDWRLCDHAFQWVQQVTGMLFTVDRIASRANRRCVQFSHSRWWTQSHSVYWHLRWIGL